MPDRYIAKCRKCGNAVLMLKPKDNPTAPDVVYCPECTESEPIANVWWVRQ